MLHCLLRMLKKQCSRLWYRRTCGMGATAMMLSELKDVLMSVLYAEKWGAKQRLEMSRSWFYTHMAIKLMYKNKCCTFVIEI
jgi:hypothetical protein